jgi:hypothetical protein
MSLGPSDNSRLLNGYSQAGGTQPDFGSRVFNFDCFTGLLKIRSLTYRVPGYPVGLLQVRLQSLPQLVFGALCVCQVNRVGTNRDPLSVVRRVAP